MKKVLKNYAKVSGKRWLHHLSGLSVVSALLSALFWFLSAQDNPAAEIISSMGLQTKTDIFGNNAAAVVQMLMDQRQLNVRAANFAGISALFQGISLAVKQMMED